MTKEFLQFSLASGNDLVTLQPYFQGLKPAIVGAFA
jgi:uncharacterized protein (DUF2237 family)